MEDNASTERRVLEAAGEVFAQKGFQKATIREIVDRADANLNAVNYYFRDKRGLYLAVFKYAHEAMQAFDEADVGADDDQPPETQLLAFVRLRLRQFLLSERAPWHARLMAREMMEPTGALDMLIEHAIKPRFGALVRIVRRLLPPATDDFTVRMCAESVVGQCIHVAHGRPVVSKLIPELSYTPEGIDRMAEHIARFSLAALARLAEQGVQA